MITNGTTKNPKIPKLRFLGFSDIWETRKLGSCGNIISGYAFRSDLFSNVGKKIVTPKNFTKYGYGSFTNGNTKYTNEQVDKKYICKKGDLLILLTDLTPTCELLGKPLVLTGNDEVLLNQRIIRLETKNDINKIFIQNFLQTDRYHKRIKETATGTTVRHSSNKIIENIIIFIPKLEEQIKIADFLSTADRWIENLRNQKKALEKYKKGMMQKIFSQEIRFKDENGKDFPNWEFRKLGDVLNEHKNKSTGNEEVFSVSVHKGLINQVEHLGRSYAAANTSNYHLVIPNDVVYTKSPTGDFPLGIIKQSKLTKNAIVSPLYGVFTPETPGLGYMLNVYFESPINTSNYLASIVRKGAKNTINITNSTFLSKHLKLPVSQPEQNKIGVFLKTIDDLILLFDSRIAKAEQWKKGLLQQMFV